MDCQYPVVTFVVGPLRWWSDTPVLSRAECANISAQDARIGVSMHGNVRILALRKRRLHAFAFLIDTLQAGGRRFDSGTLHSAVRPVVPTTLK